MGLMATASGGTDFDPMPEGVHIARCYAVIDLGTHTNMFGKDQHKTLICWEVPGERIDVERDGKQVNLPRGMSHRYTLSIHRKAVLRQLLESWRGKAFTPDELEGFDLQNVVGVPCQLQVIHEAGKKDPTKTYANVKGVMPMPKGEDKKPIPAPPQENPSTFFSMADSMEIPATVPDWVQEIIHESNEWKQYQANTMSPCGDFPNGMDTDGNLIDESDVLLPF